MKSEVRELLSDFFVVSAARTLRREGSRNNSQHTLAYRQWPFARIEIRNHYESMYRLSKRLIKENRNGNCK